MKLASLKAGGRDGTLIVVNRELTEAVKVPKIATTLQAALENWEVAAPQLQLISAALNSGEVDESFHLDINELAAPLPRTYQWLDGSAYLTHVERVRRARGVEMPPSFLSDPLMYQGNSANFFGPRDPIVADTAWGIDFEAEVAVVTDAIPMGASRVQASAQIRLLMLVNDISLRELIPAELAKGFGFLHGKPGPAFSPVAITPDELGAAWRDDKVHLPLVSCWNHHPFGQPNAGQDMQFDFATLISHAARTRSLPVGTIIGSGTVSNADPRQGCSCIVERRVMEIIETGQAKTAYMQYGDRIRIKMFDRQGRLIFGAIDQEVKPWQN